MLDHIPSASSAFGTMGDRVEAIRKKYKMMNGGVVHEVPLCQICFVCTDCLVKWRRATSES